MQALLHHDKDPTFIKRSMTAPSRRPYELPKYYSDARSTPSPSLMQQQQHRQRYAMYERFGSASARSASPALSATSSTIPLPKPVPVNPFYDLYQAAQRSSGTLIMVAAVLSPIAVAIMATQPSATPGKLTMEPAAAAPPLPVAYAGRWMMAGITYALHTLLRPFYLAGYWILYLVVILPASLAYHTFVAVAPVLGFLVVAAGVGICVGVSAAWLMRTITGPTPPETPAITAVEHTMMADVKPADNNATAVAGRPGALSRKRLPNSDFGQINGWFTEEEAEVEADSLQEDPPLHHSAAQHVTAAVLTEHHRHDHDQHSVHCTDDDDDDLDSLDSLDETYQYIDEDVGSEEVLPLTDYDDEMAASEDEEAMPSLRNGGRPHH